MKFHIETFGCQMNVADSEEMGRCLISRGMTPCDQPEDADWLIVNTCTVRQQAENRALAYLGRLNQWKQSAAHRRIVLTGCAAERLQRLIPHRFPQVDLVVGAKSIDDFESCIKPLFATDTISPDQNHCSSLPTQGPTAHVSIMRGCNYSCSYCVVPAVRGRERYRSPDDILAEVRQKVAQGSPEVLLLGQTVNSYRSGSTGQETVPATNRPISDFADLLRAVNAVRGVKRIRFMSPHPFYIDDRLARAFRDCDNLCPHIHLPVQSGSDRILSLMRRNYTRAEFLRRLGDLCAAVPGLSVTTDFIVGFPSETENDFQQTISLIDEAGFDSAYCFRYSPRPGTDATGRPDDVSASEKEDRLARLLDKLEKVSERKTQALMNTTQEVLVDKAGRGKGTDSWYEGKLRTFWKIRFTSQTPLAIGQTAMVKITDVAGGSLKGHAHP